MTLDLILEEYQHMAIVALEGCIDASNADFLQDSLVALLNDGHERIILDCQDLTIVNSNGLGIFLKLARFLENNTEGKLVLCHVSERIAGLLHISGLDRFITTAESRDDAIEQVFH